MQFRVRVSVHPDSGNKIACWDETEQCFLRTGPDVPYEEKQKGVELIRFIEDAALKFVASTQMALPETIVVSLHASGEIEIKG